MEPCHLWLAKWLYATATLSLPQIGLEAMIGCRCCPDADTTLHPPDGPPPWATTRAPVPPLFFAFLSHWSQLSSLVSAHACLSLSKKQTARVFPSPSHSTPAQSRPLTHSASSPTRTHHDREALMAMALKLARMCNAATKSQLPGPKTKMKKSTEKKSNQKLELAQRCKT